MKKSFINIVIGLFLVVLNGCDDGFIDTQPADVIVGPAFWQTEDDVVSAVNGIYAALHNDLLFGPEIDGWTPNAYDVFGNVVSQTIEATTGGQIITRWRNCYTIISRANYFLDNIDLVETLPESDKAKYKGEAHFLRGLAYALLAETYGGVPIITTTIGVQEAREISRSTVEETWDRAVSDYNIAVQNLPEIQNQAGRATKGSALGMLMRAYLYQGKFTEVLDIVDQIDGLGIYNLFPSYEGLFLEENENNQEVLFDIQYIAGPNEQGGGLQFYYLLPTLGSASGGGFPVPTQDIADEYEMIDGSDVDPNNPYVGRDPRLDFSLIRVGTQIGNYMFNTEAQLHVQVGIRHLAVGKFRDILIDGEMPPEDESSLNYIVLRYAEVLLAKAEALIETNQNIGEAIALINRIRTEREDVKITPLPATLSQSEAREALRHERRVEFAFEGHYWSDIKRWEIGPDIYPYEIRGTEGNLLETRYPLGYDLAKDNLWPIPDTEISLNDNLTQNPGY